MAAIPPWAIGRHITSVLFTPQSVNTTDGTLTDTTPTRQFFGVLQDVDLEMSVEVENISAMDRPYKNMVPIEQISTIKLTELEKYGGTCLAAVMATTSSYWKYVLTRGAQSFTGYGVLTNYHMSATKPKVTAQLELQPIDPGGTLQLVYG